MSKVSYKLGDFLRVEWDDIVAYSGWEEIDNGGPGVSPHVCESYGFLTHQSAKFMTLSATKGMNDLVQYNQSISIPLGCVTDIERMLTL